MANLTKEISVTTENKSGALAKAAGCLKEANVSIQAVHCWDKGKEATFMFLTENNPKAVEALKKGGYKPTEREVVCCNLENRVGSFAEATQKLAQAGLSLEHCYVTATGSKALCVFWTNNNQKALQVLG